MRRSKNKTSKHTGSKSQSKSSTKPPNWVWIAGAVVIILVIVGVLITQQNTGSKTTMSENEISVETAYNKYQSGVFFLDVREPSEWQSAHIPNATLIPLGKLASRVDELPRDKEIVVVCRSGNRSRAGRDTLFKAGFTQVTSMAGGMNKWRAVGYPTVSGQ